MLTFKVPDTVNTAVASPLTSVTLFVPGVTVIGLFVGDLTTTKPVPPAPPLPCLGCGFWPPPPPPPDPVLVLPAGAGG